MTQLHQQRFNELSDQMVMLLNSKETQFDPENGRRFEEIDGNSLLEWRMKAKNLLSKVCGMESDYYKEFLDNQDTHMYERHLSVLERLRAIFLAAKEDFEGGYLQSSKSLIQAEVFDSELEQARELFTNGYHSAAAVIAGVVLETTLRELCDRFSIPHGKLDRMNAELAKKKAFNRLVQKRITALADIRNSAAHGKTDEFNESDVEGMIKDVERFVADNLPA